MAVTSAASCHCFVRRAKIEGEKGNRRMGFSLKSMVHDRHCHEQVNNYKNSCYRRFKTEEEAKDDYSRLKIKEKSNHTVGNSRDYIRLSGLNNLIIFVQLVITAVLLLTCDRI